jgi:hypothetical protein
MEQADHLALVLAPSLVCTVMLAPTRAPIFSASRRRE